MILLWLKIIYFKITKVLKGSWSTWCRIQAGAGEEPHVRARVTRTVDGYGIAPKAETSGEVSLGVGIDPATGNEDGLILYARRNGKVTTSTVRLRRLIELGLVHESDGLGDLQRVERWHEDWAAREAGVPDACPCGGRHYPEPDACRWCRCHDLRNVHHTAPARGIMQVIPPDLAAEVADEALSNLFERLGPPPLKSDSAVRPSKEIVCCGRCGHPQHGENGGRCGSLVAGGDTEGLFSVCRCGQEDES